MQNKKKTLCLLCTTAITLSYATSPVMARETRYTSDERANLIYIMCDDLTTEAMTVYNDRYAGLDVTPNLDRLANQGVVLNNVYAANAICVPSRANILTGLPSEQSGVQTLQNVMNPDIDTYPKILQENGYETAMVGKWHLQSEPQGFDYYNILEGQGQYGYNHNTNYQHKSAPYIDSTKAPIWPDYKQDDPVSGPVRYSNPNLDPYARPNSWPEGHVTKSTMDVAMNWMNSGRQSNNPFMLMIHQKAPHVPNDGYGKEEEDFLKDVTLELPETFNDTKESRDIAGKDFGMIRNQDEATYQEDIKGYLRLVKGVDKQVGRLLDYMDQQGNEDLKENTVIAFTSDQGLFLGEHHYSDKRWINRESSRMPFIVSYPKEIEAGSKCNDYITNIDFAPTILDYAGVEKPDHMVGNSFRANLAGNTPSDWEQSAYYRYWANADANVPSHYGVRNDKYLLIMFGGMSMDILVDGEHVNKQTPVGAEFYDLQTDPLQTKNLYYVPEYQDTIKEMKNLLEKRKSEIEGSHDVLRYPELQERIDAFENGEEDIPLEEETLYAIGNTDLWSSQFNSLESKPTNSKDENWGTATQEDFDKRNKENQEFVKKYTNDLKHRSHYGTVVQKSGAVDQNNQEIKNLQTLQKVCFDLEYKHVYDKHIGDPKVILQFLDKNKQLVGNIEKELSLTKVNEVNEIKVSIDRVPLNAENIKIIIDNHGVETEIGLDGPIMIDATGKGILAMNYLAKPSENAKLTINNGSSQLLQNWTDKTETVTWKVQVPQGLAGDYVVSSKYSSDLKSNFTLSNENQGVLETALAQNDSLFQANFGTLKLKEGTNTITLSRNSNGTGNGNGNIQLSDIILSKIDTQAFEATRIKNDVKKNELTLNQSIRFGNKIFHNGSKTFEWETLNNGLKWKVHLDGEQLFRIDSQYICGSKNNDPQFTIKFFDSTGKTLIKEVKMEPMDRGKDEGFGENWDISSNQVLGYLDEKLPVGDYVLELGKTNVIGTFIQNVSLVPIEQSDLPEEGVIYEKNGKFGLSFNENLAILSSGSTATFDNGILKKWTSSSDTVTWTVNVSQAGKYVVAVTPTIAGPTKLSLNNKTNGKILNTSLVKGGSGELLNLGIIELNKGKNTIVLSKNNATIIDALTSPLLMKIDSNAYASQNITNGLTITSQKGILDGDRITLGNDSTHGLVTFQWDQQDQLLWKVRNDTLKSFNVFIDYAYKEIQPKYVIECLNLKDGTVVTLDMIEKQGDIIGSDLQKYDKQKFGTIASLPVGDYIVTLKKKGGNNAPARVRSISFE